MQDLASVLGSTAAATAYLNLLASNYRKPCWTIEALAENGTVVYDLSPMLISASLQFTDESAVSQQGTFRFSNPNAMFDRYTGGPASSVLTENCILRFKKGLVDPATGTRYLLPTYWGRIIQTKPIYSTGDVSIEVVCGDALKNSIRQRLTSRPYMNCEANVIADDLLKRFGMFPDAQIDLASVSHLYAFVQFPDFSLADALKTLFDPIVFSVRADEAGKITTRPRLGSALSSFSSLLGFPDQITPPASVDYTFPTALIESIQPETQDWDGVVNQVKVLGAAAVSQIALGPVQVLTSLPDSSIGRSDKNVQKYAFSQQPAGSSALVAKNTFLLLRYSTDHHIDDDGLVRYLILTTMKSRGNYDATQGYSLGDAVKYGGHVYAASKTVPSDGSHPPTDTDYWTQLDSADVPAALFTMPFVSSATIFNSDPHDVGKVSLDSVTASYMIVRVEGHTFKTGGSGTDPVPRYHGGFDYRFTIYGQPVLADDTAITGYADYGVQSVTGEVLADVFSDHRTYQMAHAPIALSIPVQVFENTGSGPSPLGKIAADQSDLSGESAFSVDYERGRIVLSNLSYQDWESDASFATGGTVPVSPAAIDFDLSQLPNPGPPDLYKTWRKGEALFTFTGLTVGQGYDIRLHFADPDNSQQGKRKFSVFVQGRAVASGLDIVKVTGGKFIAYQTTVPGISPDIAGTIEIWVTQLDPLQPTNVLPECSKNGDGTGGTVGTPIISGIEIVLPQGQGQDPFAVACGSTGISIVPKPVITANYGYSAVQATYGLQQLVIDDPLIATQDDCRNVARWLCNFSQWKRHRQTVVVASLGHIQPGDLVKFRNPKTQVDFWAYVQSIRRDTAAGGADRDSFVCYLIYAEVSA